MKATQLWVVLLTSACATDEANDAGGLDELSSTEQAISSFESFTHSSTHDLVGIDTGWSTSTSTCVMSAVNGDLGQGGYWDSQDVAPFAGVLTSGGTYVLFAHGGAYTNQTNDRVWIGNHVSAGATCVPYPRTGAGWYKSSGPPVFLAAAAPGRRCFLNGIEGGGAIFTHDDDYVIVKQRTTTDASHPQLGWYIEGNLRSNPYTGQPAFASAYCTDFPSITSEWFDSVAGPAIPVVTSGSGVKMCGLYAVKGGFDIDSYQNGVSLYPPTAQTGNWVVSVVAGKTASYRCIR